MMGQWWQAMIPIELTATKLEVTEPNTAKWNKLRNLKNAKRRRIVLDRLRAAAFQTAAWVYPGALPYMYPARTTPGHWNTQCDVHWHYQFQRTALVPFLEYDDNHTYSHHAREGKASFPIAIAAQDAHYLPLFNCNPLQLNTCLYRQKPSISFSHPPSP